MIDHVSVGVADIEKAASFYDAVMTTLGYRQLIKNETLVGYGDQQCQFLAMLPYDGQAFSSGNGVHLAFVAGSAEQVNAFYQAALEQGGQCEGAPGPRGIFGDDSCVAYVRDPFGHKLEVIHGGFAA